MDLKLVGKIALVTGGTRGIGLACAHALLLEGVSVAVLSRSESHVSEAVATLSGTGDRCKIMGVVADLSQSVSIEKAIASVREELGEIDILVGSSGGPPPSSAINLNCGELRAALETNLLGIKHAAELVLPHMRAHRWGRIVIITTSGVAEPLDGLASSNITRSALAAYAKTLSREVAKDGVTINMVMPGRIDTERLRDVTSSRASANGISISDQQEKDWSVIPVHRYGSPHEIASVITFLCSESAAYVNGVNLPVDGGLIRSY